jgi:mannose-6-phosphate isomerase-like protein (cupin superfamily)
MRTYQPRQRASSGNIVRAMAHIIDREAWATTPEGWKGELQGAAYGAGICVIFNRLDTQGGGPRLHKHPYPETFIVRAGTGLFTVGDEEITATEGQILVVPPDTPHKFTNLGPGPLETIDIHESGNFVTHWLE